MRPDSGTSRVNVLRIQVLGVGGWGQGHSGGMGLNE